MKSKTSLFDKSIIVSDLKRFLWVGVLYAAVLFFAIPLQFMLQEMPLKEEWQKQAFLDSLHLSVGGATYHSYNGINIQVILICTLPVLLAAMLFNYLHSSRAATMLHSLPLSRRSLLGSHTVAGITIMSVPVLLNGIVLAALSTATGLGAYYTIINVTEWIVLTMLFNILLFSIAVFVGMFTGNAIAHVVFTYIISVLPGGVYMLVIINLGYMLRGFSSNRFTLTWARELPFVNIVDFAFSDFSVVKGLFYLIAALVFLAVAAFVYERRKLEAAGNIIAFRILQPVFKYGIVACFVLLGGFIAGYLNNSGKASVIGAYFVFSFIGYWASQMLLDKTVRVWHAYKGFAVYNALLLILVVVLSADITGFVNRVPDSGQVESVYFGSNPGILTSAVNNIAAAGNTYRTEGLFKEGANIRAVENLHRVLIRSGSSANNTSSGNYMHNKYITYSLKNGKKIIREYSVDEYSFEALLSPIYESLEYKKGKYPVLTQDVRDIKYIEIGDSRTNKKPLILSNMESLASFTDTFKRQLAGAGYKQIKSAEYGPVYAHITDVDGNMNAYYLPAAFEAVYTWLMDRDYYESVMLLPGDIDHVSVQEIKLTRYKNSGYGYTGTGKNINIKDRALIEKLFRDYRPNPGEGGSGVYYELEFYGQSLDIHSDFRGFIYPDSPVYNELKNLTGTAG